MYLSKKLPFYLSMLFKPAHFIFYLSTSRKPAALFIIGNVLKYKDDTFYLKGHTHAKIPVFPIFAMDCQKLEIRNFISISSLTDKCAA